LTPCEPLSGEKEVTGTLLRGVVSPKTGLKAGETVDPGPKSPDRTEPTNKCPEKSIIASLFLLLLFSCGFVQRFLRNNIDERRQVSQEGVLKSALLAYEE